MLALKECLIREGVLNLNPPNLATNTASPLSQPPAPFAADPHRVLYGNRYSFGSNLNMLNNSPKSLYSLRFRIFLICMCFYKIFFVCFVFVKQKI